MSPDWRELLDRLLEGDELSAAEARELAEALGAPSGSRDVAEWLRLDAGLRERFAPADSERVALSRERLLAKAALREKRAQAGRPAAARPPRRRGTGDEGRERAGAPGVSSFPSPAPRPTSPARRRLVVAGVAAAALLAAAVGVFAVGRGLFRRGRAPEPQAAQAYREPEASGDFRLIRSEGGTPRSGPIRRGDRLVAGSGGARLSLGGYCELALAPNAEVVLRGEPRKEEIELAAGRTASRVQPERGAFRVRTPLGFVEVAGTEFITTVEGPSSRKGEEGMGSLKKSVVVTVLVVSGAVAYHFGDSTGLLTAGMSQAFAGEQERPAPTLPDGVKGFKGLLLGTLVSKGERQFVLKVEKVPTLWPENKADNPENLVGKEVTVALTPRTRELGRFVHVLGGLKVGDPVLVEAFHFEGGRLVVMELLRKAGDPTVQVAEHREGEAREGEGRKTREGEGEGGERKIRREEGEGGERPVKRGEGEAHEGEGRKKREGEGERREGDGPALREGYGGFQGLLVGTIERKSEKELVLKVERVAKVWQGNRAKSPESLVGQQVEISLAREGRVPERFARALAERNVGERIEVGAQHLEGFEFAAVEVLRKAGVSPEEGGERKVKREEGEHREGEGEGGRKVKRGEGESEGRDGDRPIKRGEGEHREGDGSALREGYGGFQGVLVGTIVEKGEDGFTLKVEKVSAAGRISRAKSPGSLIGKEVKITLRREGRLMEKLARELGELRAGDRVALGAQHLEENVLAAVEMIRKVRAEGEGREEGEGGERKAKRGEGEGEHREGEGRKIKRGEGERGEGEGEGGGRKVKRGEGEGREGGERGGPAGAGERREGSAQASAEAIQGFRGLLQGALVGKSADSLVLRVERIAKVFQSSQAKSPEALVGKTVTLALRREDDPEGALLRALADLRAGDRIVVGAVHQEGIRLVAAELLKKVDGE